MQQLEAYNKLKASLPRGAMGKVADRFNIDQAVVTRIAKGDLENLEVMEALLEEAENHKKEKEALLKRIEAL